MEAVGGERQQELHAEAALEVAHQPLDRDLPNQRVDDGSAQAVQLRVRIRLWRAFVDQLGEVLDEVSTFYTRQLRQTVKTVTSMIEPLMIIVMGGVVGFIAMAIILPIFKLSTLVR